MAHWWSDYVYKTAGWFSFCMSFVEQHVAFISILIALAGLLVRTYYDRQENRRQQELHDARLKDFTSG